MQNTYSELELRAENKRLRDIIKKYCNNCRGPHKTKTTCNTCAFLEFKDDNSGYTTVNIAPSPYIINQTSPPRSFTNTTGKHWQDKQN